MDEKFLTSLNHDLSFRPGIIKEALAMGVKFGSKEFFVYSQLRWYETDGKFGFCVAGDDRLGEDVGMTDKEVSNALYRLKECGLIEHVWCDKRVYRNKTKIWVSAVRLSSVCTNVDAIKVLKDGRKNVAVLGKTTSPQVETTSPQVETTSPQVETTSPQVGASPVKTGVGNTNRNTKERESSDSAFASSDPFSFAVSNVKEKVSGDSQSERKKDFALCNELLALMNLSGVKAGVKLRNAVRARLREGYSEIDLRAIARWSATQEDEFYRVPHSLFSEAGVAGALALTKETKPKFTTMRTI